MQQMDNEQLRNFYAKIRDWLNEHRELGYTEVYSPLRNDEDRIRLTLLLLNEHQILDDTHSNETARKYPEKDLAESQSLGFQAEQLMRRKRLKPSVLLDLCTKSICYAPVDTKELAVAYGRRATGLFKVRLYEDALQDIERATQLAIPPEQLPKLSLLRTKCLVALYGLEDERVAKASRETRECCGVLDGHQKGHITLNLNKIDRGVVFFEDPVEKWNDEGFLPQIKADNSEIPGALSAVEIRYSGKYRRHLVATRDIEIGEVIAVQEPYVAVLELDRAYSNCWHCLKQVWAGIPCNRCVNVVYCSEACKVNAWIEYHDVECDILGAVISEQLQVTAIVAIRLLIRALKECGGWEGVKQKLDEIESNSDFRTKGFTNGILDHTKYSSVIALTADTEKRTMEDLFRLSVGSATITYILATMTEIFGGKLSTDVHSLIYNERVIFTGGLILRHLQIYGINSQMSCEWDPKESLSYSRAMVMIPLYGLINHSCNPNVTYSAHGKFMALHAISPIKKGEQLFDSRGIHYADVPREERQLQRKEQFFFICDCAACTDNWPLFDELSSYQSMPLSESTKKKLNETMCGHNFFVAMKHHSVMERTNVASLSIASVIENLKALYKYVQLPCREICEVVKTLENIYNQLGNRVQSLD